MSSDRISRRAFLGALGTFAAAAPFSLWPLTAHAFFNTGAFMKKRRGNGQTSNGYTIGQSLRFNGTNAYLSRNLSSSGNKQTWTFSTWVKRSAIGAAGGLIASGTAGGGQIQGTIMFNSTDTLEFYDYTGSAYNFQLRTNALFRDPSAWYHIVGVYDSNNATQNDRARLYVNGQRISGTDLGVNTCPTVAGTSTASWNTSLTHYVGATQSASVMLGGYLAEVYFIDGQALDPTSFGQTDSITGQWIPKKYAGTYGSNGFYLPFQASSGIGDDSSGNSNHWTATGFSGDVLLLHCDGANNSTQFTDSAAGKTITASGAAKVSTAASQFGGACATFDGSSWVTTPANTDFQFGTGDFTVEFWINPSNLTNRYVIGTDYNLGPTGIWAVQINNQSVYWYYDNGTSFTMTSSSGLTTGVWAHLAFVRKAGTLKLYVNGTNVSGAGFADSVNYAQNRTLYIGSMNNTLGGAHPAMIGYLDEIRITKGYARYTANFSTATSAFTPTCFDQTLDSPTNNFCTLNPLASHSDISNTVGNLTAKVTAFTSDTNTRGCIALPQAKIYFEHYIDIVGGGGAQTPMVGVLRGSCPTARNPISATDQWSFSRTGQKLGGGLNYTNYGAAMTAGETIGVAFDGTTGKLWFRNASGWFSSGDPVNGTNEAFSGITDDGTGLFPFFANVNVVSAQGTFNFGQGGQSGLTYDSASGGRFKYTPPAGFKALCTANLTAPAIKNPSQYFDVKLLSHNGSSSSTAFGWNPDPSASGDPSLFFMKNKGVTSDWYWHDSVRGITRFLNSNLTNAEYTASNTHVVSAAANGQLTLGSGQAAGTFVIYGFRKGATPKMDIVAGTRTASPQTFNHSLGAKPDFMIIKDRTDVTHWVVYHKNAATNPETGYLLLSSTAGFASSPCFNNTAPTSTQFTITTSAVSSSSFIAYLWAEVPGFSKFGSYTGNGVTDGPFVYCGFKPKYVLIKITSTTGTWEVFDSARDQNNEMGSVIEANTSVAEATYATYKLDFLSNGFKLRNTGGNINASSASYVFAAFAESPFKYSTAR